MPRGFLPGIDYGNNSRLSQLQSGLAGKVQKTLESSFPSRFEQARPAC